MGTGKETGSYSIIPSQVFAKSIISVFTNGKIALNFGAFRGHESITGLRDDLAQAITREMDISIPEDYPKRYPNISSSDWVGAPKSSRHRFQLQLKFNETAEIFSPPIVLDLLLPRRDVKDIRSKN